MPLRLYREGSSAWLSDPEKGSIIGAVLDYSVGDACHFCGNRRQRLAFQISVISISRYVSVVFVTKAVLSLTDRNLTGHPERAPQPRIAILRELALAAELAGLVRGQIQAAELQELTIMSKAAQVTSFGEYGQGVDRPNARQLSQSLIIGMLVQGNPPHF